MAANNQEFFEGSVLFPFHRSVDYVVKRIRGNSDGGYGKPNGAKFKRNFAITINISDNI